MSEPDSRERELLICREWRDLGNAPGTIETGY